jgi:hypothetical protein
MIIPSRRSFLFGLVAAPAVIRVADLMPIKPLYYNREFNIYSNRPFGRVTYIPGPNAPYSRLAIRWGGQGAFHPMTKETVETAWLKHSWEKWEVVENEEVEISPLLLLPKGHPLKEKYWPSQDEIAVTLRPAELLSKA